jgi:hypothetical protein
MTPINPYFPSKSPHPPSKPQKSLPQHPPLSNPKVEMSTFWTVHVFKPVLECPPNLIQSKRHPRGQPLLTLSFSKNRPQSGWIYGPLELRAKILTGYETPCETPGEFTDFFIEAEKFTINWSHLLLFAQISLSIGCMKAKSIIMIFPT